MSRHPVRSRSDEVFCAFVRELAASPQSQDILCRLRDGHLPDAHGWCRHHTHSYRWQRHPCSILLLADLVEETDGRQPSGPEDTQDG